MSREPDSWEFFDRPEPLVKWPLNLGGLIAWLETQDPETKYNWNSIHTCLVARFMFASTGKDCRDRGNWGVTYEQVCGGTGNYHFIGCNGKSEWRDHPDWTFGRALERAKEVQQRQGSHTRFDSARFGRVVQELRMTNTYCI